jgi:hypothetical protein
VPPTMATSPVASPWRVTPEPFAGRVTIDKGYKKERIDLGPLDVAKENCAVTFVLDKVVVAGPFDVPSKPRRTVLTVEANANDGIGWYSKAAAVAKVNGC